MFRCVFQENYRPAGESRFKNITHQMLDSAVTEAFHGDDQLLPQDPPITKH
jgi:hypothetical protein